MADAYALPLTPLGGGVFGIDGFGRWAGRWVHLRARMRLPGAAPVWPRLLLDCGWGYLESRSLALPPCHAGSPAIDYVAYVPAGVEGARLDAASPDAAFEPGTLRLAPLSTHAASVLRLKAIAQADGIAAMLPHAWREFLTLLRRPPVDWRDFLAERYQDLRLRLGGSYEDWIRAFEPPPAAYPALLRACDAWPSRPRLSVLLPVHETPEAILREAVESVRAQLYPHWELCIADDASRSAALRECLRAYERADPRIKVVVRERNGRVAAATNSALGAASGDFVALLDHDDRLHPLALYFVAEAIARRPDAALVYTDEDKIDAAGRRHDPYFKCEFNYELMLAQNMICHLGAYRRALVEELGGLADGLDGAQDYDLALRVLERAGAQRIVHVPRVLYHWRAAAGSTALAPEEKPYAAAAGRRAVAAHLARRGVDAAVEPAPGAPAMNRVRFALPAPPPGVSILIPTRDRAELLAACLDALERRTRRVPHEILLIDNGSREPDALELLRRRAGERVRVLCDARPFNYAALNNLAAREARHDFLCLMNNDIEVLNDDWLEEMLSFALQPGVGAVGARLWYPSGRLQHAGVILGLRGAADHAHRRLARGATGYFCRALLHQSFSALTGACLLVRKADYQRVGGMDEELPVTFNDIDFCLRLREAGLRNVWTPYAEMTHHESASRGTDAGAARQARALAETRRMERRWGGLLERDPAYSPNLTLAREDFSIAWPPRLYHSASASTSEP